jgi:predicted Zn finger-like uncharacterized protein
LIIKCSNCGARYRVSEDLVANGPKRFKCKSCGTVLLVKAPETAKAPPQEKPPTAPSPPSLEQQPSTAASAPSATSVETEKTIHGNADEQGTVETEHTEESKLSPEEIAAQQQKNIQEKLEERRRQMEDEISGRLNKAALETLDFDVLSELAHQVQDIQHNHDFKLDSDSKLFSCIKCKTTYCLFPDDSRLCANCPGEISLVRADDILKQFGMFG